MTVDYGGSVCPICEKRKIDKTLWIEYRRRLKSYDDDDEAPELVLWCKQYCWSGILGEKDDEPHMFAMYDKLVTTLLQRDWASCALSDEISKSEVREAAYQAEIKARAKAEAEVARLNEAIDEWQRVGDRIMKCATGKPGPLSDSDVIGEIVGLRNSLKTWQLIVREGLV